LSMTDFSFHSVDNNTDLSKVSSNFYKISIIKK
jgi:hypothetical protein